MEDVAKAKQSGFTLIELIVVLVILAIISSIASVRFMNLSSSARTAVIKNLIGSARSTSKLVNAKGHIGFSSQIVPGRDDLLDVDLDGNGTFETRLKWGHLDNTDVEKRLDLSDDISIEYRGIANTYFGFDLNNNASVRDDNCYFHYIQAGSSGDKPEFIEVTSGC